MSEIKGSSAAKQDGDDLGPLRPFLILKRASGGYAVAAYAEDNKIISLAPLRIVPDPPRRRLIECPCCDRWIVISEWPNGMMTITPLPKAPDDDIPF